MVTPAIKTIVPKLEPLLAKPFTQIFLNGLTGAPLLYAAGNHMTRLFVPFLKKLNVTYPQYLVLVVLWENDGMSVGELATALLMDLGSISPMLKRMEKKGLVVRGRDPNDERRVVVSLSASGRALRARTKKMLGEFYCYLSVPVEELEDLRDRLHRFTNLAGPSTSTPIRAVV